MQAGRWREALELVERLKKLLDEIEDTELDASWGVIPGQWAKQTEAYSHWNLGNISAVHDSVHAAIAFVERYGRPFMMGMIYTWVGADLGYLMREVSISEHYARKAIELCERFPGFGKSFGPVARICLGWAETQQGQVEDGLARMTAALDDLHRGGARAFLVPRMTAQIAEVLGKAGRPEEGLRLLAGSPDRTTPGLTPSRFPEIHRIEGELLLKTTSPDLAAAEAKFEEAIAIARPEESITQELRASISLARLWHEQDKDADARGLLTDVMRRFPDQDSRDYRVAAQTRAVLGSAALNQ